LDFQNADSMLASRSSGPDADFDNLCVWNLLIGLQVDAIFKFI